MALQGSLDTFSLPDVMRLLATTTKTGRLRIEGDRGQGSVWLRDGSVVDADADRSVEGAPTEEVIFELLRFDSGSFAFESDDRTPNAEQPDEVEGLLRRAGALLSEWTELKAVVPSLDHRVALASELPSDEVTIDSDRWRSVVAVATGRSVGDLAGSLGLSELNVSRAVRDLVELGVADVEEPGAPAGAFDDAPRRERRRSAPRPSPVSPNGAAGRAEPIVAGEAGRAGWHQASDHTTGPQPAVPTADHQAPAVGQERAPVGEGRPRRSREAPASRPPAPPVAGPDSVPPAPDRTGDSGLIARLRNGASNTATPRGREPSPFNGGRLAPPPAPTDTGQIRAVSSSSLPPDLHWAAADASGPTTGPITSPFSGLTSLGGQRVPADGEIAPHLAAMSPDARAAVQSTVGNAGRGVAGRGPAVGDDAAQRGRLINFLSTVR
ncbi:MAG: DUF4388 domain-containing protein [Acidimicrobiales bacterium]